MENNRKKDHIDLAPHAQIRKVEIDNRFNYEPLLSKHPVEDENNELDFLGKTLKAPIWISSMTGGTKVAKTINSRLAKACREFGLGMGVGSCRTLLASNKQFDNFNLRPIIGNQFPFYANLGISQIEQAIEDNQINRINEIIKKLEADGLIIHINPIQEWLQPEGDRLKKTAIETLKKFLEKCTYKVIVKEVGQGIGPKSLESLLKLPIDAIDFGAFGGTNFTKIEIMRNLDSNINYFKDFANIGHTAEEMVAMCANIIRKLNLQTSNKKFIISGGITNFLDGFYLIKSFENLTNYHNVSIFGYGNTLLEKAKVSYLELKNFISTQINGLKFSYRFLNVK